MANISNFANSTLVSGTAKADSIYNSGYYATINASSGNDTVNHSANYSVLNGGNGADLFELTYYATANTVTGGKGNDTVSIVSSSYSSSYANVFNYASGDGDDVIIGLDSDDTIHITKGSYTTTTSGLDVILNVDSGSITLKDAALKPIQVQNAKGTISTISAYNFIDSSDMHTVISGTKKSDAITNSSGRYVTIESGAGADVIYSSGIFDYINAGAGNDIIYSQYPTSYYSIYYNKEAYVTIRGGTGDDTVYIEENSYNNLIDYASGDGNDTIIGFNSDDTLHITKGSYTTTTSGDDVIVSVGSGSITFKDALVDTINLKTATGSDVYIQAVNHVFNTNKNTLVSGTNDRDYIQSYGRKVTINAGKGDDTIFADESSLHSKINAGAGVDIIYSYGDYSSINGGSGKDSIYANYSYKTTIKGGSGSDFISLGSYANQSVIQYASGEDKDTVYGFGTDDTLQITSGSYSVKASGDDVIVTVDKGSVTLKDAAGQNITIVDSDGKSSTKTYSSNNIAELFAEDNFIDENNFSALVENKSVGAIQAEDKITVQENLITFADK